ncbi:hypothetical protein Tco_0805377 [Tanacetum coccineum]
MSSNSDDIQAAGSDTRPPMLMLDRTDYESWSQRIRLYCRGKENGLQILQSIDQWDTILSLKYKGTLGTTLREVVLLGPERPRTYGGSQWTRRKKTDTYAECTVPPILCIRITPKDSTAHQITTLKQKQFGDNVLKCFLQV